MKTMKKLTNAVCLVLLASTIVPAYGMNIHFDYMNAAVIDAYDRIATKVENASYDDIKWYLTAAGAVVLGACVCNQLYNDFVRHVVRNVIKELDARKAFVKKFTALHAEYWNNVAMYEYFGCWNSFTERLLQQEFGSKMLALVFKN